MTTEFVLILGLYAFILLGAFVGDNGPASTFKSSAPRFAAMLERDISVGKDFKRKDTQQSQIEWADPGKTGGP
ncbi:MAG: hypothetical protein ABL927_00745 [Bdellovibrionales bacterium]